MAYTTIAITRQQLYERVWKEPVRVVAKQLGVSDVGLAKMCQRLSIPTPGLGYWAKKQHGKRVRPVPLPASPDAQLNITITPSQRVPPDPEQAEAAVALIDAEYLDASKIRVGEGLVDPHPLIVGARVRLQKLKPSETGLLPNPKEPCLDINVSPPQLDRALRIMDALVKALDQRSLPVSIANSGTAVTILGEVLGVSLVEHLNKTERPLTRAQKKELADHPWMRHKPEYDYSPSGKLVLCIHAATWSGMRRQWSDSLRRPIENALNSFLIGAMRVAVTVRAERLERERRDRQWKEAQRRREELARLKQLELKKLDALEKEVESWHKSQRIRAYLAAVQHAAVEQYGRIDAGGNLGQWLHWAGQQADRLDPLVPRPPSVLDEPDYPSWS